MRLLRLFKKDLAGEVTDWIGEGIVNRDQGEKILARYGATLEDAKRMSIGYWALTGLGVLFAGLSLILFVSSNWDEIPRGVRMGALFAMTLLVNGAGVRLFLKGKERAAVMALFFGSISYGVSIMLVAQIYHLGEHYPDGVLYWALGVLPLVVLTRSRVIAFLAMTLAIIWLVTEANENFFPWLFPLFITVCGWLAVKGKPSSLLFLICVASVVTWVQLFVSFGLGHFFSYEDTWGQWALGAGMLILLIGLSHYFMLKDGPLRDHGLLLSLWLLRGLLIVLLVFSFADVWPEYWVPETRDWILLGTLPVLAVIGVILARRSGMTALFETGVLAVFLLTSFVLGFTGYHLVAAILINLLLLISGIWLIRRGVIESVTHFYYTGIALLLITAVCRYFDLIGDYVGASLVFLVAAGVLFGSARFWKSRMKAGEGEADAG